MNRQPASPPFSFKAGRKSSGTAPDTDTELVGASRLTRRYASKGAILVQTVWICLATAFSGMPPIEAQKYTVSTGASPTLSRTRRATSSGVP